MNKVNVLTYLKIENGLFMNYTKMEYQKIEDLPPTPPRKNSGCDNYSCWSFMSILCACFR